MLFAIISVHHHDDHRGPPFRPPSSTCSPATPPLIRFLSLMPICHIAYFDAAITRH